MASNYIFPITDADAISIPVIAKDSECHYLSHYLSENFSLLSEITFHMKSEYPSNYWSKNVGAKPEITIFNLDAAQAYAVYMTKRNSDTAICTLIAKVIAEDAKFQFKLEKDWKADGITIGKKGDIITPLSLLSVTTINYTETIDEYDNTPQDRLSRAVAVLSTYRRFLYLTIDENFGQTDLTKMTNALCAGILKVSKDHITEPSNVFSDTAGFKRLICAIDMFLNYVGDTDYSIIRMCTSPSRYRGCTALILLGQISRHLGLHPSELALCAVTEHVAKDIFRLGKTGEGSEDPNGYFPYHFELGMVIKSAYSTISNPTLTYWLHTIGVVSGYQRSYIMPRMNATDAPTTFGSGVTIAACFSTSKNLPRFDFVTKEHEKEWEDVLVELANNNVGADLTAKNRIAQLDSIINWFNKMKIDFVGIFFGSGVPYELGTKSWSPELKDCFGLHLMMKYGDSLIQGW